MREEPGRRYGTFERPRGPVVTTTATLVATSVTVTRHSGTTAPASSRTSPVSSARPAWAVLARGHPAKHASASTGTRTPTGTSRTYPSAGGICLLYFVIL